MAHVVVGFVFFRPRKPGTVGTVEKSGQGWLAVWALSLLYHRKLVWSGLLMFDRVASCLPLLSWAECDWRWAACSWMERQIWALIWKVSWVWTDSEVLCYAVCCTRLLFWTWWVIISHLASHCRCYPSLFTNNKELKWVFAKSNDQSSAMCNHIDTASRRINSLVVPWLHWLAYEMVLQYSSYLKVGYRLCVE